MNSSLFRVDISCDDLYNLRNKYIGSGTEANVFNAGNGMLYKVYKAYDELIREPGVGDKYSSFYSEQNIITAMSRQPYIHNTSLPLAPLYIDDEFRGCVIKKHSFCFPIQGINMLSKKRIIIILKKLLNDVKEWCDNGVYHLDLSTKEIDSKPHSNVLVNISGIPKIIDLDGKSTIYSDSSDLNYEYRSYLSLSTLILELLYDIDPNDDMDYNDVSSLLKQIYRRGVNIELIESMLRCEADYKILNDTLDMELRLLK